MFQFPAGAASSFMSTTSVRTVAALLGLLAFIRRRLARLRHVALELVALAGDRRRDRRHPAVLEEGAPVAKEPRDRVLQRLTR